MATVRTVEELDDLYDAPVAPSLVKEIDHITPLHRAYIEASPFVVVASCGPGGLDCSPWGDPAGFVRGPSTSARWHLPDRRGNNRLDTLRNLVVDPRIGLLFLIPGVGVTLRVNGTAVLSTDADLLADHEWQGKRPTCVVVVTTTSVYTQCPKALVRSNLWDPDRYRTPDELPSVGQINELITSACSTGRRSTRGTRSGSARRSTDRSPGRNSDDGSVAGPYGPTVPGARDLAESGAWS